MYSGQIEVIYSGQIRRKIISIYKYTYVPHTGVSVNDGPHIRRWSHNIVTLTTVLQMPTVISTVTCCTGL